MVFGFDSQHALNEKNAALAVCAADVMVCLYHSSSDSSAGFVLRWGKLQRTQGRSKGQEGTTAHVQLQACTANTFECTILHASRKRQPSQPLKKV